MRFFIQNKTSRYFFGLFIIFVLIEVVVRFSPTVFSNLTERIHLKSAMFEYRDTTEVLFLGSSRFKDGLSPKIIEKQIKDSLGLSIKAFNGALTGTNVQQLDYFFKKAITKKGLRLVVVEISFPQLYFDETYQNPDPEKIGVEEHLQNGIMDHLKLAAWRKSFRIENLIKAPAILATDFLEGSELDRSNFISDYFNKTTFKFTKTHQEQWRPKVILPQGEPDGDGGDCSMHILQDIARLAKENNVKLLLVIPPVINARSSAESTPEVKKIYQTAATKMGMEIWDYGDIKISEKYFSDQDSHLNIEGRFVFSHIIGSKIGSIIQKR